MTQYYNRFNTLQNVPFYQENWFTLLNLFFSIKFFQEELKIYT